MNAMWKGALCFVLIMVLTCALCAAQPSPTGTEPHAAVVTAIGLELEPIERTEEVRVLQFADFSTQAELQLQQKLFEGDLLEGRHKDLRLELQCNRGSRIRLSGEFRIAINARRDGQDCALNLLAGSVDVITDQKTEINAGGRIMGSVGTHYAVIAEGGRDSQSISLAVFEGAIELRNQERTMRIAQMSRLTLQHGAELQPTPISRTQYERQARLLAEFDTLKASRLRVNGAPELSPQETVARLARLNEAVLISPDDPLARLRLASAQSEMEIGGEAQFNLSRLEVSQGTIDKILVLSKRREGLGVEDQDEVVEFKLQRLPELERALEGFEARQLMQPHEG